MNEANTLANLFETAISARIQGDRKLALELFEKIIQNYPQDINAYYEAAIELRHFKRFVEADERFKQVLEKEPNHIHALFQSAINARLQGKRELAIKRFDAVTEKHPQHISSYYQAAMELKEMKRFTEAEAKFQEVLCLEPNHLQALFQSAVNARLQGNRELAIERFDSVTKKHPDHTEAYYALAIELSSLQRFSEAEEKFQQVLQKNPNHLQALFRSGICAKYYGNNALAIQRFLQVIEKKPDDVNSCYEVFIELRKTKRFLEAEDLLRQALDKIPNHPGLLKMYYENRGDMYQNYESNQIKALQEYQKAFNLDKKNLTDKDAKFLLKMSYILCSTGREIEWANIASTLLDSSVIWQKIQNYIISQFNSIDLNNYIILFMQPRNVGDTANFLCLLKSLSQKFQKKIILFMADSPVLRDLYELFKGDHIFECYFNKLSECSNSPELVIQPIQPGKPSVLSLDQGLNKISNLEYTQPDHLRFFRLLTNLAPDAEITYPRIPERIQNEAVINFNTYKLKPGKTVLIAPLSHTYNSKYNTNETFKNFWNDLCDCLNAKGFDIAINGLHKNLVCITNVKYKVVEVPLIEIITFVEYSGFFIGMRSGLCDLLSFAKCHKTVVYPPEEKKAMSLKNMGYNEITVDPKNYNIEQVLSNAF